MGHRHSHVPGVSDDVDRTPGGGDRDNRLTGRAVEQGVVHLAQAQVPGPPVLGLDHLVGPGAEEVDLVGREVCAGNAESIVESLPGRGHGDSLQVAEPWWFPGAPGRVHGPEPGIAGLRVGSEPDRHGPGRSSRLYRQSEPLEALGHVAAPPAQLDGAQRDEGRQPAEMVVADAERSDRLAQVPEGGQRPQRRGELEVAGFGGQGRAGERG